MNKYDVTLVMVSGANIVFTMEASSSSSIANIIQLNSNGFFSIPIVTETDEAYSANVRNIISYRISIHPDPTTQPTVPTTP